MPDYGLRITRAPSGSLDWTGLKQEKLMMHAYYVDDSLTIWLQRM